MATVVTGYVRLNSGHRNHGRYLELGRRLLGLGLPTVCCYDGPPDELQAPPTADIRPASLDRCWMREAARGATDPVPGDGKDTAEYVTVQHQKSAWLAQAARHSPVVIWIDFGIFHLPCGLTDGQVVEFVRRVEADPPKRICLPGIWPLPVPADVCPTRPAWYAAGGVVVMPAADAAWFDAAVRYHALSALHATGRATWEVNTWAAVIRAHPDRFAVWPANHDASLFAYRSC